MTPTAEATREPYRLFDSYTCDDRHLYFGREEEVLRVVGEVLTTRLLVLFAPSGSGKSSLINAGVRPKLEERGFATVTVRLDGPPELAIKRHLREKFPEFSGLSDETDLHKGLQRAYENRDGQALPKPLVLFLDQFEEFFIVFGDQPSLRRAFIKQVSQIKFDTHLPVYLVLSLRDDYFVNLNEFRDEIPSIFHNNANIQLRPLNEKAALRAIRKPAEVVGLRFEPGLPEQIVRDLERLRPDAACEEDLSDESCGVLPITLQIVCHNLWLHRPSDGGPITRRIYEDEEQGLGGAAAIIRSQLERSLRRIPRHQQGLMRRLFRALMTADLTKRLHSLTDLAAILRINDKTRLQALLRNLTQANILREKQAEKLAWYEFRHDYLVTEVAAWLARFEAQLRRRRVAYTMGVGVLPTFALAVFGIWYFLSVQVRFSPRKDYDEQQEELYVTRRFNPFGLQVTTGILKDHVQGLDARNQVSKGYPLPFGRPRNWLPLTNLLDKPTAATLAFELDGGPVTHSALIDALDSGRDTGRVVSYARNEPALIHALSEGLRNPKPNVRLGAAQVLGQLGKVDAPVVDALLALLKDDGRLVRLGAARALVQLGNADTPVVDGLLALLKDGNPYISQSAAQALGQLGKADTSVVHGLLALLKDDYRGVRQGAAQALGQLGKADMPVVHGLLALLKDGDPDVRQSAAQALGQLGKADMPVIDGLLALLKDDDPAVRQGAAQALVQLGKADAPVVDRLLALLKDDYRDVRQGAAQTLGQLGKADTPVIDGLLALLKEDSRDTRLSAAQALVQLRKADTPVIDGLLALLKDSDPYIRQGAAQALGQLDKADTPVVDRLLAMLKDDSRDVRLSAEGALGQLGKADTPVADGLLALLKDGDPYVRHGAAQALVQLGRADTLVVDWFFVLLKDGERDVRQSAAEALGKLGQKRDDWSDALLLKLMQDNLSGWRQTAAMVLAYRDPLKPETLEKVRALRKDPRPWVRMAAWEALYQIDTIREVRDRLLKEGKPQALAR